MSVHAEERGALSGLLCLDRPQIMGVINVTPDSFYPASRHQNVDSLLKTVEGMQNAGAAIIDIGGESTRPGVADPVSLDEELTRVIPPIEAIKSRFDIPISIDTSCPEVMGAAIDSGVSLVNDVRALERPGALQVVAQRQVPVCLMHMRHHETNDLDVPQDESREDILKVVSDYLTTRVNACVKSGIVKSNIIIDPGFGGGAFGKSVDQDLNLLHRLHELKVMGLPILVGLSRKSFIGAVLDKPVEERLPGSLAAAAIAVYKGAKIIRTHDVAQTSDVLQLVHAITHGVT